MAFGNGKSGTVAGIAKIGESLSHSIDNLHLVDGLQHNLLSMSQLCDKGNLVVFSPKQCLVININSGDVMLRGSDRKMCIKYVFFHFPKII